MGAYYILIFTSTFYRALGVVPSQFGPAVVTTIPFYNRKSEVRIGPRKAIIDSCLRIAMFKQIKYSQLQ